MRTLLPVDDAWVFELTMLVMDALDFVLVTGSLVLVVQVECGCCCCCGSWQEAESVVRVKMRLRVAPFPLREEVLIVFQLLKHVFAG